MTYVWWDVKPCSTLNPSKPEPDIRCIPTQKLANASLVYHTESQNKN